MAALLVTLSTVLMGFSLSSTANAHIKTWTVQSNENFIPHSGRAWIKDGYILMPEEHRRVKKEMASVSCRTKADGAAVDLDTNHHHDVKDNSSSEGAGEGKSGVNENNAASTANTELRSKNPHSTVEPGSILEDLSTPKTADFELETSDAYDLETNLTTESAMSSDQAEVTSVLESDAEEHSFSNEKLLPVNESGKVKSLSEVGKRQALQHNITENMTENVGTNHLLDKDGNATVAEALRSHVCDDYRFHADDNTEADSGLPRSRLDQNNSQGADGEESTKYAFPDSLFSQEDEPQASFDNFDKAVETRHAIAGQAPSYLSQSPPAAANLRSEWNKMSDLCVVPCSPMNYQIQPYAYGPYGFGLGQSYAAAGQAPHQQLPPVQFPEAHSGAQGSANVYGGAHTYGSILHPYVQEPTNHLEYGLDIPQTLLHTPLLMKAPQPPQLPLGLPVPYAHPYLHHTEQNIDLHKSTYF